ncbi:hypothetical protein ACOSP7_031210 [Xanthoceras sorbifolium]
MVIAGLSSFPSLLKISVMSTSSSSKEEKEVLSLARTLLKEGTSPATIKSKLASCVIRPTQVDEDEDSEGMSFGSFHPCKAGYSQDPMDDVYDDEHNPDPYKV